MLVKGATGWFVISVSNNEMCVGRKTGIFKGGVEIIQEAVAHDNHDITIKLGSHTVQPHTIGLPNNIDNTYMTFAQYLDVLSQCRPCIGKDATHHLQAELITCNNVTSRRQHSGPCYRIVPLTSKGDICRKCYNLKLNISSGDGDDATTSLLVSMTSAMVWMAMNVMRVVVVRRVIMIRMTQIWIISHRK